MFRIKYKIILFLAIFLIGCSNFQRYSIKVTNNSEYGLLLIKFPAKLSPASKNRARRTYTFYPKKNAGSGGSKRFIAFDGIGGHRLPDEITIKWQLASLENCKDKQKKYRCDYIPIESKTYEKVISLRSYQQTEVFQNLGKTSERGWPRKNTAELLMVFTGEDVEISVRGGSTKLWR